VLTLGAHVDRADPLAEAQARSADLVQFFLGDPQGWKKPEERADVAALRAADVQLVVHAPYIVNVASLNNKIRIPSRKILQQHCDAAAEIGASAIVVHGGHVGDPAELETGLDNWRKTIERLESRIPVLIENTAGGTSALARRFDALARLWDAVQSAAPAYEVGFCLDTCHAHAGGEELVGIVDRVLAITGRIDLVHANDSRDAFDSGADRHANLGSGQIDPDVLVEVVRRAGAPVVCETPGGAEGQAADIAYLRTHL
jgi:deoxyribonuclease IV